MIDITREEISARIEASEARVASALGDMRTDLKSSLADVSIEMGKIRSDFHQLLASQTKWLAALIFGAVAATGTLLSILQS